MKVKIELSSEDLEVAKGMTSPPANLPTSYSPLPTSYSPLPTSELSPKQLEFALAAATLVNKFIEHAHAPSPLPSPTRLGIGTSRSQRGRGRKQVKFADAYNHGAMPELFEVIGKRSVKTLRSWQTKYVKSGKDYRVLAPDYKIKKASCVTPQEADILLEYLLTPNQPLIQEVIRASINHFEIKRFPFIKSFNTYKRFLEDWIKNNQHIYIFRREGKKALWDKVMPYLPRDWNRIPVGYLVIMDGHHNNYETINCFPNKKGYVSGKPKRMMTIGAIDGRSQYLGGYEIAPTENVMAIASALRRFILLSRLVPVYLYIDNGKAFLSKVLTDEDCEKLETLFNRLGIKTIIAKKYHPQSKPIEPFWKWMAELERKIPTYVGTSISKQPPRLHRGEFEHRAMYESAMENVTIDIYASHAAMAWWLDEYHNREKTDGHLKGTTPAEVFAGGKGQSAEGILMPDRKTIISEDDLDFLMMDMKVTKLYRNGIRAFGTWYLHEDLFGKQVDVNDEVHFKYSLFESERDHIIIYDRAGNRICKAFRWDDFHPVAKAGTEEDREKLKQGLAFQKSLENSVTGTSMKFMHKEIIPHLTRQLREANIIGEVGSRQSAVGSQETEGRAQKKKRKKSFFEDYDMPDNKEKKRRAL